MSTSKQAAVISALSVLSVVSVTAASPAECQKLLLPVDEQVEVLLTNSPYGIWIKRVPHFYILPPQDGNLQVEFLKTASKLFGDRDNPEKRSAVVIALDKFWRSLKIRTISDDTQRIGITRGFAEDATPESHWLQLIARFLFDQPISTVVSYSADSLLRGEAKYDFNAYAAVHVLKIGPADELSQNAPGLKILGELFRWVQDMGRTLANPANYWPDEKCEAEGESFKLEDIGVLIFQAELSATLAAVYKNDQKKAYLGLLHLMHSESTALKALKLASLALTIYKDKREKAQILQFVTRESKKVSKQLEAIKSTKKEILSRFPELAHEHEQH